MKKLLLVAVAAIAAVLSGSGLYADDYPSRPVTFTAVFGPGSASDTICRIIADPLGAALKQPVIVEDRPGADGAVAALYVHHQPADGYNLLMATNSPLSADPFLHKDINYDPIKDFTPVTRVGSFTLMLVVDPKLPIHSVKELVDYAKANPGKLTYASGNTAGIVGMETVKRWAEISILHVPYKSTPPAIEDIIGGRVSMMFADFTTACRMSPPGRCGRSRSRASSAVRYSRNFRPWMRPESRASTWTPGPAWSRRPARRRRCRQAQRRAAPDHRQPGGAEEIQECRLRGIFFDPAGAG